ncbi:hypothetical protein WA026_013073 [Henosepilachna vigintioctopunctata]|uniref:MADF domain-containing protein n=1 Tax=Henosepilachna vigintioctopunctata TaxID=420089 RepID=A0AAW1UE00_9CUCU
MSDAKIFIKCIQDRPSLWDKTSEEYLNKSIRDKHWEEIGEIITDDWQNLNRKRKHIKVKEMKNKWRHIRDNFRKFLNQGKADHVGPKRRKYIYADSLKFLLSSMDEKKLLADLSKFEMEECDMEEDMGNGLNDEEGFDTNVSSPECKPDLSTVLLPLTTPLIEMFDVEKFIKCIQCRPALWDKSVEEYANKNSRDKLWSEIGEINFDNWHTFQYCEKIHKVREMKNKWRNIRDNYRKYLNQEKISEVPKRRKYLYADHLSFLIDTMDDFRTSVKADSEEGDYETEENRTSYCEEDRLTMSAAKLDWRKEDEDAEKSFLMSLLPDFKRLNEEEKMDFKLMTLHFFKDILQSKR